MKCFSHPQADAVAQCSQCQKGVCTSCAHDVEVVTLCTSCFQTGLSSEIAHAKRTVVGVWVFTGVVTVIAGHLRLLHRSLRPEAQLYSTFRWHLQPPGVSSGAGPQCGTDLGGLSQAGAVSAPGFFC